MMSERKTLPGAHVGVVRRVDAWPYAAALTSEESVDNGLRRRMYVSQHGGNGVVIRCALTLPYHSGEGYTT